tara:strand:+ start:336 stop:533 length:198 start_codon:yes stop_codon:yes gene_type:complete
MMLNFLIAYESENGWPEFEVQLNKLVADVNKKRKLLAVCDFETEDEVREIMYEVTNFTMEKLNVK